MKWIGTLDAIKEKAIILVPGKRCETCLGWKRFSESAAIGYCHLPENVFHTPSGVQAAMMSDVSVCSLWTRKAGEE